MPPSLIAYVDESSSLRETDRQEYLVCAVLISDEEKVAVRDALKPLRLRGQIKLHWTDESSSRRKKIVQSIAELQPMTVVISHLSERRNKTERFRRKCLENLYYHLCQMHVGDALLESRMESQNKSDVAHLIGLRSSGVVSPGFTIDHCPGADEPLLWLPDIFLGAINSLRQGQPEYFEILKDFLILEEKTADSM